MILSRYFDKGDYGTYKQVMYVYSTLLSVFTLGLPKAFSYFLPRVEISQAKNLIKKITNLFFILGGVFSLLLFIGSPIIASILKNPDLNSALKIFAIVPFLMLPTMGLEGVLATYKKTMFMAIYTIVTRTIMLLCVAIPVLLFNTGYHEALIGFVIASTFEFILALYLKYYPIRHEANNKCTVKYSEIFKFSFPLLYASIWGSLLNSIDQFFISRYFGNEVFADFSNGALELPFVSMIVGATTTVLTPLFSQKVFQKGNFKTEIYPIWTQVFEKSAMLIYPIVFFCIFDANLIMTVMYGDLYETSGDYFRIKLFTYFVKIIAFYPALLALNATKFYAKVFQYAFLVLLPLEYLVATLVQNPLLITGVHVFTTISYILIFLRYIAKKFGVSLMSLFPIKSIIKIASASILSIIFIYIIRNSIYFNMHHLEVLIIDLSIFTSIFIIMSILMKLNYYKIIKPLFNK